MRTGRRRTAAWMDGVAVAFSAACLVHCLALPLLIALLPVSRNWLDIPESFHLVVLLVALPPSGSILWRAARLSPRAASTLRLGLAGLAFMIVGAGLEGHSAEVWITSLGASLLAAAHLINWRRRAHCHQ